MKNNYLLFLGFLIIVSHNFLWAQSTTIKVSKTAVYFLNKRKNEFIVFDDSTYYYKIKAQAKKWEKQPFYFKPDHLTFSYFKEKYLPISLENGRILFVYSGIGEVYELKNDTLQRIDQSFKHENQFCHSLFEYKNTVYAFGGYGLFTFKNILTFYNFANNEWLELLTFNKPNERNVQFHQMNKQHLYVFGGIAQVDNSVKRYNDCWEFSFLTNKWKKLGTLNASIYSSFLANGNNFPDKPLDIIISYPNIWVIDISTNKLQHYINKLMPYIHEAYFDKTKTKVLLVSNQDKETILQITSTKKLLNRKVSVVPFYEAIENKVFGTATVYLLIISLILVLGTVYFIYRTRYRKVKTLNSSKVADKKIRFYDDQFFVGTRLINGDLTLLEYRILKKFFDNKTTPIDIITLNELFEDESSSLAAQKKRRETTLKTLREKLAFFLNITQEQVFLESRDSGDKRIKLFVINPDILAD